MPGTAESCSRRWDLLLVAGVAAFAAVASIRPTSDPDLFWHLHTGDWIRAHHAVPEVDSFSHTFAGRPIRIVDWLSDLVMAAAYAVGGFGGLSALFAVVAAGIVLVTAMRLRPRPRTLLVLGLLLVHAAAANRIYPRPQTFTLLLAPLELLLLERAVETPHGSRQRRWLWVLPPLVCLWSNLHRGAPLGLALLLVFALGDLAGRRSEGGRRLARAAGGWALLGLACTAGLVLASNPLARLDPGLLVGRSSSFSATISEWQRPGWEALAGPVGALGVLTLAGLLWNARAVRPWEWLLVAFSVALSRHAWRFVPFFGLLGAPVGLRHLALRVERSPVFLRARSRLLDGAGAAALVVLPLAVAFGAGLTTHWLGGAARPAVGVAADIFPVAAARFVAREQPQGRMFNSFHWGGYLMWAVPGLPVFIDGRTETLYDEAFVKENVDARWRELFPRYGVDWAMVLPSALGDEIAGDERWAPIYFDDVAEVYVRRQGGNAALATRLGYRFVTPNGLHPRATPADLDAALGEARRAVAAAPDSGRAHLALATVLLLSHAADEAEREIERAEQRGHNLAIVWYRAGMIHLTDGRPQARAELERAVELAPPSPSFRDALALACLFDGDVAAAARAVEPVLARGQNASARLEQLSASPLGLELRARRGQNGARPVTP